MKILHEVEGYINLLESRSNWLMRRTIAFGTEHKCLKNIDSAQNQWLADIQEIANILVKELREQHVWSSEISFDNQIQNPFIDFARQKLSKSIHSSRYFADYIFFIKYSRKAFLELIENEYASSEMAVVFSEFVINHFENLELAFMVCQNGDTTHTRDGQITNNDLLAKAEVFNYIASPVLLITSSGVVQYCNNVASKLLVDFENSGVQNKSNLLEILKIRLSGFLISSQESAQFEATVHGDNNNRVFQFYLHRVADDRVLVLLEDLTEHVKTVDKLKNAQHKAEESDRLKTAFLANMSHEIRTPMNAIIGFTELILNKSLSIKDSSDYLKLIRNSSTDLLNIIEDIIDVAKLESNQLKMKYKVCKPYTILEDLKAVFIQTLRKYGHNEVELQLNVEDKFKGATVYTDGERLKQVLTNLLSNAAKFTEKGYIRINFNIVGNSSMIFSVTDTGVGIPDAVKEKVFNRFFQVESHLELNMGGAGLGLAISKSIVHMLGGTIKVDSESGKGSCFTIQIPIHQVPKTKVSYSNQVIEHSTEFPDFAGKTILVAEDDRINYFFLKEILSATKAKTLWAKNGIEAIEHVERERDIDLILMDIKMPELDGFQAAKYISSINPGVPIIAQTAYAMDGDELKCRQAGCMAYITKPIDKAKLFAIMNTCLKQKHVEKISALSI